MKIPDDRTSVHRMITVIANDHESLKIATKNELQSSRRTIDDGFQRSNPPCA